MSILVVCLIVYILGILVTWCWAGYQTGIQFTQNTREARRVGQNPGYCINYVNVFFQGLCWVSFWASMFGEWVDKRRNGDPMKIPIQAPRRPM